MRIELEKSTRDALSRALCDHLRAEFDLDIGRMDAQLLLDFISERLGPHYYNQGLHDARAHLHAKLEALGEALYELEKPAKL